MKIEKPFAVIKDKYISLDQKDSFSIDLCNMDKDHFLVLDTYPIKNPAHPQRHPGWFKFMIDNNKRSLSFRLNFVNGKIQFMSVDKLAIAESWLSNVTYEDNIFPLNIRVVIRKKINNEIVFETTLICYKNLNDYIEHKTYFELPQNIIEEYLPVRLIIPEKLNVCIILKNFYDNDAIGYFAWEMYSLLKKQGINAELYAVNCDDKFRSFTHHVTDLLTDENLSIDKTIFIYNYSIKDDYLEDILDMPYKKIAYFHGITNPQSLRVFDAELAEECKSGLDELYKINGFDFIMVNSRHTKDVYSKNLKKYNESLSILNESQTNDAGGKIKTVNEKVDTDLEKIKIIPPVLISEALWNNTQSDGQFGKSLSAMGDVLLFVGRMFPHKKIEDLLNVFHELLKINPNAILALVGGMHNSYQKYLKYKIDQLTETEKERILFLQQISRNQLKAAYQASKVFITLSDDEGFCVPILEAMRFHVPIVAKKVSTSAADELLKDAGKLAADNDAVSIAEEVNKLMKSNKYREKIVSYQDKRLVEFSDEKLSINFIDSLLGVYYKNENID
ncbi:glycosyltransferase [Pectinatus haikarae]|uniref:Glycosyltransferase involved in cell wall biosynthesis n=1 Tax=Pectinatus haikarae TaxID=349096 RepID=A0ABT9YBH4_9FIRM|nr:glycosyltransferase [Pectinatus haikarae]MDQ0205190.1 glycosyltransferase involved in cell wall biosynthesis [Pectinatus haikarae]